MLLSRLLVILATIEIIQLLYFSHYQARSVPPSNESGDMVPVDQVYDICLKTFSPKELTEPKKIRTNIDCNNGFWDKNLGQCICDIDFIGDMCNIGVVHKCNDDMERAKVFVHIWDNSLWQAQDTKSGPGSTIWSTTGLRESLPNILVKYNIKSVFDSGCGDFNWMKYVRMKESVEYVGTDIVPSAIRQLRSTYEDINDQYNFYYSDMVVYPPYKSFDLIITRDAWQHLSNIDRERALKNYENSKSKYLMASYYEGAWDNSNAVTGHTRYLNLLNAPHYFPQPLELIEDKHPSTPNGTTVKIMGLWKLPIQRTSV
jgi:SAM-dependent methyltransferase